MRRPLWLVLIALLLCGGGYLAVTLLLDNAGTSPTSTRSTVVRTAIRPEP